MVVWERGVLTPQGSSRVLEGQWSWALPPTQIPCILPGLQAAVGAPSRRRLLDRLVRATAAMTSSSRDFPGGALGGRGQEQVGLASTAGPALSLAHIRRGHLCVHQLPPSPQALGLRPSYTPSSGYRPPNLQETPGTGPGAGVSRKPEFSAIWVLSHGGSFRPWSWIGF